MKPVIIISIAFVLLIPFSAFAQEESLSELTARLDAENLQKAEEYGTIVDPSGSNVQQQTQEMIDCPSGYIQKAISGGGIVCVNEITGQQLGGSTGLTNDQIIWGSVIISFIIIIYAVLKKKSSSSVLELLPRMGWTSSQHREVLARQDGKCAKCGEYSTTFQYDHMDNNRNNNDLDNCQALCPNCHDVKSRGLD